jgi:hypothetical protein
VVIEPGKDNIGDYVADLQAYREAAYDVMSTPVTAGGGERLVMAPTRLGIDACGP